MRRQRRNWRRRSFSSYFGSADARVSGARDELAAAGHDAPLHRSIPADRHRPRLTLDEVDEPSESPPEPDFFLRDRLRRLTAALPERARAVVVLRYQEDLEPAEISQVLGIPVNTVKSHLQRALATLREKMERTKVRQ